MRRTGLLIATWLLAASAARAGDPLLDTPGAARGDSAAHLEAVLEALARDPRAPEVPLLLHETSRLDDEVPGGKAKVRGCLEALLAPLGAHWNRDDVLARLVDLRRAAGDRAGALAAQEERAFLRSWVVTGPFGFGPGSSLEEVYEPELIAQARALDPRQRFALTRGEAGWTPVEQRLLAGAVDVSRAVQGRGAVCYALTHFELGEARRGTLVYTGPSARIWLNRGLVSRIDRELDRLDVELRIPVTFQAGWNRVLVKVSGGRNADFSLRLTDEAGGPLPAQRVEPFQEVEAAPAAPPVAPWSSFALAELAGAKSPEARALYANALMLTGRGEEAWVTLGQLLAAEPALAKQAWCCCLQGDVAQRADHLPEAVRRDQAQRAYQRALELDPRQVLARRRLAEFAFQDDRVKDGIVLLEQILTDWPDAHAVRLRLFDALLQKRWEAEAEAVLAELRSRAPELPGTLQAEARLLEADGRGREAQAVRERLLLLDPGLPDALLERMERAQLEGDFARAAEALSQAAALLLWDQDQVARARANLAEQLDRRELAVSALRERLAAQPDDVERRLALAQALAESALEDPKAAEEALALLGEVLAAAPERHEARALLQALERRADRFWDEWEPDVAKVLAEAPPASHWPQAATVCLFDQTVTRIYPDCSAEDVVHQVFRILDDSGKERYGSRPQAGDVLLVRTITPDGQELHPIRAGNTFEMPGLAPGAAVEHAFRRDERAPAVQYTNGPFYFADPDLTEPFWLSRWVIWVHRDAPVVLLERNLNRKGIRKEVQQRGEWTVNIYTAVDQPRVEQEPMAPNRDETLPWVKVVERRTLEQIGNIYRERATSGLAITPTVAAKAAELTQALQGDTAKAEALFRFVAEHVTRPGAGSAAATLAARAGNKTGLYLALLRAAGVPARLLLAAQAPSQAAPVNWDSPEPGQFFAPVIKVEPGDGPARYVFMEGPKLAPWDRLPPELWGASAYVCDLAGGSLDVLPSGEPGDETVHTRTTVTLEEGGAARFEVRRVMAGYQRFALKEAFASATAQQLRGFFARQANSLFPGSRVGESGAVDVKEPGRPFQLRFVGQTDAGGAVRARGDGSLELRLPFEPLELVGSLGSHRQRLFDLVIQGGICLEDEIRIELGPYVCPRLPATTTLVREEGQYSLRVTLEGGQLRIERRLLLRPGRVLPKAYPEFREFLREIDQAEARTVVLEQRRAD